MATVGTPHSDTRVSASSLPQHRWRASVVVAAVLLALITWWAANLLDSSPVQVRMQDEVTTISGVAVVLTSAVAALAGWVLLAVLERLSGSGRRIWTAIAVAVLALSLFGPLNYGIDAAATWSLIALHVVTGAVLIAGLSRVPARG